YRDQRQSNQCLEQREATRTTSHGPNPPGIRLRRNGRGRTAKKQDVGPLATPGDTEVGRARQTHKGPRVSLRISLSILVSQAQRCALVGCEHTSLCPRKRKSRPRGARKRPDRGRKG